MCTQARVVRRATGKPTPSINNAVAGPGPRTQLQHAASVATTAPLPPSVMNLKRKRDDEDDSHDIDMNEGGTPLHSVWQRRGNPHPELQTLKTETTRSSSKAAPSPSSPPPASSHLLPRTSIRTLNYESHHPSAHYLDSCRQHHNARAHVADPYMAI